MTCRGTSIACTPSSRRQGLGNRAVWQEGTHGAQTLSHERPYGRGRYLSCNKSAIACERSWHRSVATATHTNGNIFSLLMQLEDENMRLQSKMQENVKARQVANDQITEMLTLLNEVRTSRPHRALLASCLFSIGLREVEGPPSRRHAVLDPPDGRNAKRHHPTAMKPIPTPLYIHASRFVFDLVFEFPCICQSCLDVYLTIESALNLSRVSHDLRAFALPPFALLPLPCYRSSKCRPLLKVTLTQRPLRAGPVKASSPLPRLCGHTSSTSPGLRSARPVGRLSLRTHK